MILELDDPNSRSIYLVAVLSIRVWDRGGLDGREGHDGRADGGGDLHVEDGLYLYEGV